MKKSRQIHKISEFRKCPAGTEKRHETENGRRKKETSRLARFLPTLEGERVILTVPLGERQK